MKLKHVFERKENKYLLTYDQCNRFKEDLERYMLADQFGKHTISSVYYDTDNFKFINHSMKKPDYKEKFRVRQYGQFNPNGQFFLEIKKKVRGIVYKRRLTLSYNDYLLFKLNREMDLNYASHPQIAREINWLFNSNPDLHPRVAIMYDRLSYFCHEQPEFRVTFDENIRFRDTNIDLEQGTHGERVTNHFDVLMEVKAMGAYPIWFSYLLTKHGITKGKFSKYAYVYQHHLFNSQKELLNVI
ncbi:VTC domain-containing protein [Holzapfeliella sp. JNUCC 72]